MKRKYLSSFVASALLLAFFSGDALSVPSGNNMRSRKYLVTARDLDRWSFGLFMNNSEREVTINRRTEEIKVDQAMATLGYDVTDWMNLYLSGGSLDVDRERSEASGGGLFGLGFQINLLDHDIQDPSFFEDTIRLNLNLHYAISEAEIIRDESSMWSELSGSLTANLINDNPGSSIFFPHRMILFMGPAISMIDHNDISGEKTTGFVGGMEIVLSESVSFTFGVEHFDNAGFSGGLHLRF